MYAVICCLCCHVNVLLSLRYFCTKTLKHWNGIERRGTEILRNVKVFPTVLEKQLELNCRVQIAGSHSSAKRCVSSSLIFKIPLKRRRQFIYSFPFADGYSLNNGCVPFTAFLFFLLSSSVGHITSSSVIGTTKEMLRLSISGREPEFALWHKIIEK